MRRSPRAGREGTPTGRSRGRSRSRAARTPSSAPRASPTRRQNSRVACRPAARWPSTATRRRWSSVPCSCPAMRASPPSAAACSARSSAPTCCSSPISHSARTSSECSLRSGAWRRSARRRPCSSLRWARHRRSRPPATPPRPSCSGTAGSGRGSTARLRSRRSRSWRVSSPRRVCASSAAATRAERRRTHWTRCLRSQRRAAWATASRACPWAAPQSLPAILAEASCALCLAHDGIEHRLAQRTRLLDLLSAGVPFVCTQGDSLGARAVEAGAATAVPAGDSGGRGPRPARVARRPRGPSRAGPGGPRARGRACARAHARRRGRLAGRPAGGPGRARPAALAAPRLALREADEAGVPLQQRRAHARDAGAELRPEPTLEPAREAAVGNAPQQ